MRLGALLTPADGSTPHHLAEKAKAIEAAGFDDVVVMIYPGGPAFEQVRSLV